jgi:hypothetical protein
MMAKKESIEDILRRHDLEEAELILREQLDKEEENENEMRKLNPNYEPLKPPRPPAKRKYTNQASAKLGKNQQLVIQLLRGPEGVKQIIQRKFAEALYPGLMTSKEEKRAKLLFNQAIRQLKNRGLVTTSSPTPASGRRLTILELTEPARTLIVKRKPVVLENLMIRIVNEWIKAGRKTITSEEIIADLAKSKIISPYINTNRIGRILSRYAKRKHTKKCNIYQLPALITLRPKPKNTKRNWKVHPQYLDVGVGVIRIK